MQTTLYSGWPPVRPLALVRCSTLLVTVLPAKEISVVLELSTSKESQLPDISSAFYHSSMGLGVASAAGTADGDCADFEGIRLQLEKTGMNMRERSAASTFFISWPSFCVALILIRCSK